MNKLPRAILLPILVLPLVVSSPAPVLADDSNGATGLDYPDTRRIEHYDDYHGTKVHDPYRWLEDDVRESDTVADWVERQNEVTFGYLGRIPERERIKKRLTELWDYEKLYTPWQQGGRYFVYKNDGLQNQNVLWVKDSLDGEDRVLIDPNTWSDDGTVAMRSTSADPAGKYFAYAIGDAGSDWRVWRIMDIDSGMVLDDKLEWVKFSGAEWTRDGQGFFYGRFDQPEEGQEFQSLNLAMKIYYHRVGTPQSDDVLVYSRPDHPDWSFWPEVTEDGKYLVIHSSVGTDARYRIFYRDLSEPMAGMVELIDNFDHEYSFVASDGPVFYFQTNNGAPRRRVIAIDTREPEAENWREIVPESEATLTSTSLINGQFVVQYLEDAKSAVRIYSDTGELVRAVDLPGIGRASGFSGEGDDTETFYTFSSFATPPSVFRYDLVAGTSELMTTAEVDFDQDDFTVEQIFYSSKDGTRVPMFLAHRKGIERDGTNPTLLYGYGGFDIPMRPSFSITRLAWMEMGGVFAMANLRGGGEYGEEWHKAGTKLQKQNVFDDFIAAAEWLIDNQVTAEEKLAIQGGSNGGLLVGAAMTQRPDLFQAALPAVGVMDMLRFHKFTAGRYWTDDYGSSDDPEEFEALYAYSPYHNLEPADYPATLVTTADTDDRVVPGHSFKFAAQLQNAHTGESPVLIRIETRAGHGGGTPTSKRIEQYSDLWGFLVKNLDMELAPQIESDQTPLGAR
ncbi:MAG: prolyl oligopeptidase family protein [Thermoanaerobaculia bacterium]